MAFDIDQRYRIKRSAAQEEQMRYLVNELKLFQSLSQLLAICAMIGYKNKRFATIDKYTEPVLMNSFSQRSYDLMNLIAYGHQGDQSVLKELKQFPIFENYAAGGFPILIDQLKIDFIQKERNDREKCIRTLYSMLLTDGFNV